MFFKKRPDYFRFLFGGQNVTAHLRPDINSEEDYPPFVLLKETYLKYLDEKGLKKTNEEKEIEILKIWSSAHGLAAIACMSGVVTSINWEDKLTGELLIN